LTWNWTFFLLGAVGALAPEAVRLYQLRNNPASFTFTWFYVLISIPFLILGGVMALVLPAENAHAALYAGISTPLVVNSVFKHGAGGKKKQIKAILPLGPARPSFKAFVSAL
jgi:hypothetical protein